VKLENTFTVPVTADVAWRVLLDVERIAPCMPGATLTGRDGDDFTGTVKVKVGPVSLTYGGKATFASLDETNRVAVIEATGKETRGSGTAKAVITARMKETDGSTQVDVETDLTITGKPAQFGRGVMAEISGKLITQFADCLADTIAAPQTPSSEAEASGDADPTVPTSAVKPTPQEAEKNGSPQPASTAPMAATPPLRPVTTPRPTPEAIDLLGTAGLPVLKRLAPVVAVLGVVLGVLAIRRHRR
jgi:carbon monoxide dehydrogenase subunit G